jgi:site-specific DNA recombinase
VSNRPFSSLGRRLLTTRLGSADRYGCPFPYRYGAPVKSTFVSYDRLSKEKDKAEVQDRALERLATGCDWLAQDAGVTIDPGARFSDPDTSAYDRRKTRPEFQAALSVLPSYAGLIVADLDRLTRNHFDLEQLIALVEDNPHLKVIIGEEDEEGGVRRSNVDLGTEAGKVLARELTAKNRRESTKLAGRQRKRHRQARDEGRVICNRRPFGLQDDKRSLHTDEVALIRKAVADILGGKKVNQVAKEWTEAGVLTTAGKPWTRRSIRNMLLNPRMTGVRTTQVKDEDGKIRVAPWLHSQTGKPVQAHEPILDSATWRTVCEVLQARGDVKVKRPNNMPKHLFSSLLWATKCQSPMWHMPKKGGFAFRCEEGCCSIDGPKLYEVVETALLVRWAERSVDVEPEVEPFTGAARLAEVDQAMETYKTAAQSGKLPPEELVELLIPLRAERNSLRRQEQAQKRAQAEARVKPTDFLAEWTDEANRRRLLEGELNRILISPPQKKGPYFDPDRIGFDWSRRP